MTKPAIGGREPVQVEVKAGETYWWCACGQSKNQPFCVGSHEGTPFLPLEWTAERDRKVWFCTCKRTGRPPLCDGSHNTLEG